MATALTRKVRSCMRHTPLPAERPWVWVVGLVCAWIAVVAVMQVASSLVTATGASWGMYLEFLPVPLVAIGGVALAAWLRAQRRRGHFDVSDVDAEVLTAWALSRGLTPLPGNRRIPRVEAIPFALSYDHRVYSTAVGWREGGQVAVFHIDPMSIIDDSVAGTPMTVAVAATGASAPLTAVQPRSLADRVHALTGVVDVETESAAFNSRWRIVSAHPRDAHALVSPRVIDALESTLIDGAIVTWDASAVTVAVETLVHDEQRLDALVDLAARLGALAPTFMGGATPRGAARTFEWAERPPSGLPRWSVVVAAGPIVLGVSAYLAVVVTERADLVWLGFGGLIVAMAWVGVWGLLSRMWKHARVRAWRRTTGLNHHTPRGWQ